MAQILTASTVDGNVASPLHGPSMGRSIHPDSQRLFPSDPQVRPIAARPFPENARLRAAILEAVA